MLRLKVLGTRGESGRGGRGGWGRPQGSESDPLLTPHPQISHTFTDYGPGVRFIRFEHGGQDCVYWKGWFGARVTNSSVWVEP